MSIHWGGRGAGHINRLPRAIGQNPYSGATMLLDFTNPVLDPRITFSRGTNATLVDSTGKITYAPANLVLWSQDFSNAAWAATTATKTSGVLDPLGGTTASTITATAGNGQILQSVSGSAGTSQAYVSSIWLRRRTGTGAVWLFNPNGAGITAVSLTTSWAQYSVVGFGAAATNFAGIRLATSGDEVDVAFAQFEAVTYQTTPGTYVATTASAYYGPRFDYDPVTLAPRGLLIEEARTNLLLRSDDFANAAWSVINATITANATASPDGTINADLVTYTGVASNGPRQLVLASAGAKTYSFYVKNSSGARYFQILTDGSVQSFANYDIQTQTTGTVGTSVSAVSIINAGNGWYRLTMTATDAIATNVYIGLVASLTAGWSAAASSGAFFVYGAQLEAGAFATSYIPTVASTVTRNAENAFMTGTNFSSWYNQSEGTFIANGTALVESSTTGYWTINVTAGANANSMYSAFADVRQLRVFDGAAVEQVSIASSGVTALVYAKTAAAYKLNDFAVSTNGGAVVTDTSGTLPAPTQMLIGSNNGSYNGWIAQLAYYNTRLPNTQLQTLTAPSLASPLALDFISPTYTVGY